MIGEADWREMLQNMYAQYNLDCQRLGRMANTFDEWAIERVWTDFVSAARFIDSLPPVDQHHLENKGEMFAQWGDWETAGDGLPSARKRSGQSHGAKNLARNVLSKLIIAKAILRDLRKHDRPAFVAVRRFVKNSHKRIDAEALAEGKRFVFDWLTLDRTALRIRASA